MQNTVLEVLWDLPQDFPCHTWKARKAACQAAPLTREGWAQMREKMGQGRPGSQHVSGVWRRCQQNCSEKLLSVTYSSPLLFSKRFGYKLSLDFKRDTKTIQAHKSPRTDFKLVRKWYNFEVHMASHLRMNIACLCRGFLNASPEKSVPFLMRPCF